MAKRTNDPEIVKTRLKELRKEKGLTQLELSNAIHFSVSTIKQYENGYRIPDKANLDILANFYGVPARYILGEIDWRTIWEKYLLHFSADALSESQFEIQLFDWFYAKYGINPDEYPAEVLSCFFYDIDQFIREQVEKLNSENKK